MPAYSLKCYSIPDLLRLMRTERGERVRLDVGSPPALIIKGESFEIEGPPVEEESVEEMLRVVASSRQIRAFRESATVDILVTFEGGHFLVRAVRAFSEFRLELHAIAQ
jgi:Tfp pilus assembly ATPase PilU